VRLVEREALVHVDDLTGHPTDERVGESSPVGPRVRRTWHLWCPISAVIICLVRLVIGAGKLDRDIDRADELLVSYRSDDGLRYLDFQPVRLLTGFCLKTSRSRS
jgi:hypothetical protein